MTWHLTMHFRYTSFDSFMEWATFSVLLKKTLKILILLNNHVCKHWLNTTKGFWNNLFLCKTSLGCWEGCFIHRKRELFIQLINYSWWQSQYNLHWITVNLNLVIRYNFLPFPIPPHHHPPPLTQPVLTVKSENHWNFTVQHVTPFRKVPLIITNSTYQITFDVCV